MAGSEDNSRTVRPPRPVRRAVTTRLGRARPARWRAVGECEETRADDSETSAASSASRRVSWVVAKEGGEMGSVEGDILCVLGGLNVFPSLNWRGFDAFFVFFPGASLSVRLSC